MVSEIKNKLKSEFGLTDNEIDNLLLADSKPEIKSLFLDKVSEIKWLKPMISLDWFNPSNEPPIISNEKGYLIPQWNVLNYLEKITKSDDFKNDINLRNIVLDIIKKVSDFKSRTNFDNYRTSWFFIKYLSAFPNEEIEIELLEDIKSWFKTKFHSNFLASEIIEVLIPKFLKNGTSSQDIKKIEKLLEPILFVYKFETKSENIYFSSRYSYKINCDYYWINKLVNNEDFLKKFSLFSLDFFKFLKDQITKTLIISEDYYAIKLENDTVVIDYKEIESNFIFEVSIILNVTPNHLIYNFNSSKYDKMILAQFKADISEREKFICDFTKEFFSIEMFSDKFKTENKNIALNIYYSLFYKETFESMYDDTKEIYSDTFDILNYFLKAILIEKLNNNEEIENKNIILTDLINDPYLYFKKLYLYISACSKNDYSEIFWNNLDKKDINEIIFEGMYFGDEIKKFLNKLDFSKSENISKIDKYIERGSIFKDLDPKIENYSLKWKQRIYEALKKEDYFQIKYAELKQETRIDYSFGPAIGKVTSGFIPEYEGVSPYTKDEIIKMDLKEFIQILNKINSENSNDSKSKINGLYNIISEIFRDNPNVFTNNLSEFINGPFRLKSIVLSSIYESLNGNKKLNYSEIIIFLNKYYNSVDWGIILSKENNPHELNDVSNLHYIFRIFKKILINDDLNLETDELNRIYEIIYSILPMADLIKTVITEYESEDYFFITINSKLGSIIECFIYMIRRKTLTLDTNSEFKWDHKDKEIYNNLLTKKHFEAYSFLGEKINLFTWFDKNWLYQFINKSDELFNKDEFLWKVFMDGYFWNGRVYSDIFPLMKNSFSHYLELDLKENRTKEAFIQQIAIGYLNNFDNLSDGLIKKLLKSEKHEFVSILINYFWRLRESIVFDNYSEVDFYIKALEQRKKILSIWKILYDDYSLKIKSELNDGEKTILSNLCKLTCYLFEIDSENINWIKQCVSFVYDNYNSTYLLEYLNILKDKGKDKIQVADYIVDLYLLISEVECPDYKPEDIISILDYLQKIDNDEIKGKVNKILDKYIKAEKYKIIEELRSLN